jgi:hypothetical protein
MRTKYGGWIVLTGFGLAALVAVLAIFRWNDATNAATTISATTSLVGAVASAFLGSGSNPWGRREQRPLASGRKRCSGGNGRVATRERQPAPGGDKEMKHPTAGGKVSRVVYAMTNPHLAPRQRPVR